LKSYLDRKCLHIFTYFVSTVVNRFTGIVNSEKKRNCNRCSYS